MRAKIELSFTDEITITIALTDLKAHKREMLKAMKGYKISEQCYIGEITRLRHLIEMFRYENE